MAAKERAMEASTELQANRLTLCKRFERKKKLQAKESHPSFQKLSQLFCTVMMPEILSEDTPVSFCRTLEAGLKLQVAPRQRLWQPVLVRILV